MVAWGQKVTKLHAPRVTFKIYNEIGGIKHKKDLKIRVR